ncbi:hypothetical protein JRI60_17165 [Archangium violaceum]|uniref:hypothetical protein n=1 Tax=Archangium violaceum TaxID=83451 RepID=UPI001952052A|nr:hypothetical protein [Archangium violaceum]QRO00637.1 hypothetical protein JRI60_17165 [Archangium violaceum]
MKSTLTKVVILAVMLLGLPLVGTSLVGHPHARYFEFPPRTHYVQHAGFSWTAFFLIAAFTLCWVVPLLLRASRTWGRGEAREPSLQPFPWWGWAGLAFGGANWLVAWTRMPWFEPIQVHTFSPLWLAYILVINALTYRRTGRCMLMDRPRFFLMLFPVSATFWWFFEYLNRFVQNWYYVGTDLTAPEYFWAATLPFATVLPAVLGTQEWLRSFPRLEGSFASFHPIRFSHPRLAAVVVLSISGLGLAGIGVWPDFLFPLLWVSPVLILVSLQALRGERHVLSDVATGDWRLVVSAALASVLCGFFWEMWNVHSLNKWIYSVPYVHRFLVFEMPLLGFAGYLPFGLECAALGDTVAGVVVEDELQPESVSVSLG